MLFDYNSFRFLFYCLSLSDRWPGKRQGEKKVLLSYIVTDIIFFDLHFPFPNILSPCLFCWKNCKKQSIVLWLDEKRNYVIALYRSQTKTFTPEAELMSVQFRWGFGHNLESSQIWGFRVQCLHYKPVSNQCCSREGRKALVEVTVNS